MKPLLSSLEGMTSMYMASQTGPHTAQSIRDIIVQLRGTPMFAGKVEDDEAEEEPKLKYQRLTPNLSSVYRSGDATSSFLVSGDKMVCQYTIREVIEVDFVRY